MNERQKRLARLMVVQEKVRAVHETRHAALVREAIAARQEAEDAMTRKQGPESLHHIFPDIYERRIASALARAEQAESAAREAAARLATENVRVDMTERAYRSAQRQADRLTSERETGEAVERTLPSLKQ